MSASRGRCVVCLLPVRLRKDGGCAKHKDVDPSLGFSGGMQWIVCPGTGKPPRGARPP